MYYIVNQEGFPVFQGETLEEAENYQTYVENSTLVETTQVFDYNTHKYENGVFVEVTSVIQEQRRKEREEEFAITLDKVNVVWYNSLTSNQVTALESWRQEWLDYPSTGILPTRPDIF